MGIASLESLSPAQGLAALALAALALALAVLCAIVLVAKTRVSHFYPSGFELVCLYVKLLVSPLYKVWGWRSRIKPSMKLDKGLAFSLPFAADADNVGAYVDVTRIDWGQHETKGLVPPFYVASQFLYPTVCLLSRRQYLFPVLGAVHVSNVFRFYRPLPETQVFNATLKVHEEVEMAKRGMNVTFSQVLLDGATGAEAWLSRTTVLVPARHKHFKEAASAKKQPTTLLEDAVQTGLKPKLVKAGEFQLAQDEGLRFAAVVADWNPIHLYKWTAQLFGFRRPIIHGMYLVTRCFHAALAEWTAAGLPAYPVEIEIKFVRPAFLPGRVAFEIHRVDEKGAGPRFIVIARNAAQPEEPIHMQGTLRAFNA